MIGKAILSTLKEMAATSGFVTTKTERGDGASRIDVLIGKMLKAEQAQAQGGEKRRLLYLSQVGYIEIGQFMRLRFF
jgi:hypothetical protein